MNGDKRRHVSGGVGGGVTVAENVCFDDEFVVGCYLFQAQNVFHAICCLLSVSSSNIFSCRLSRSKGFSTHLFLFLLDLLVGGVGLFFGVLLGCPRLLGELLRLFQGVSHEDLVEDSSRLHLQQKKQRTALRPEEKKQKIKREEQKKKENKSNRYGPK